MSMKRIIHGFVHPQLKIEPTAEVVFVGTGETLLATLTLINEDSVKKVAVKLKTNLPGTSISVRPKIALIEPRQKVCMKIMKVIHNENASVCCKILNLQLKNVRSTFILVD